MAAIPAQSPAQFAALDAAGQERSDTAGLLVQYCDGRVEMLLYSAHGPQLPDSRLLTAPPASSIPTRLVQTETDRG